MSMDVVDVLAQSNAQLTLNSWVEKEAHVILKTETTGLCEGSEVVEIAVVDLSKNILYRSYVKPTSPIPAEVSAINEITNDMLLDVPTFGTVWNQLYPLLKDKTLLIYNAEFDMQRLVDSGYAALQQKDAQAAFYEQVKSLTAICVMRTYSDLIGQDSWVKLSQACGYTPDHGAAGKCFAVADVIGNNYKPQYNIKNVLRHRQERALRDMQEWNDKIMQIMQQQKTLTDKVEEWSDLLEMEDDDLMRLISREDKQTIPSRPWGHAMDINDDDLPF